MKNFKYLFLCLALVMITIACNTKKQHLKEANSLTIESPYLGQKPPGLTPKFLHQKFFH